MSAQGKGPATTKFEELCQTARRAALLGASGLALGLGMTLGAPFFHVLPARAESEAVLAPRDNESTDAFLDRLNMMLDRTEKSIKLAREQIVQSQSAPFLPQLYMQLAELLTQKSNTLYYIKMERDKSSSVVDASDKAFSPVIQAQKEAIQIYRQMVKDFPFFKKTMVQFRLATALKSIDEIPAFIGVCGELLRESPGSEEATRIRLLLGQYYFEKRQDGEALRMLTPVAQSKLPYERNLAKYRIGLIEIARDRFRDALTQFEQIVRDEELKEQDNPYELSFKKKKSVRTDLKRDALIDSIRAYTHVYEKDPDPLTYYARLAPTEVNFQEIIEKIALRYINLRKYSIAVKLLRALSERTADPQKIMSIYHEVLLMIPPNERIQIPVAEMQFILEKYNAWSASYDMSKDTTLQSFNFFEKQIRDFGTVAHGLAKTETNAARKTFYLERARDSYLLYLGYFPNSPNAVKIATNLGDVYFAMGKFLESGDYYLRVYQGEFGKAQDRRTLIENAILCFEKKASYPFYESVRLRGLLIRSIQEYVTLDRKKANDPKLAFVKLKAEYQQGFFPEVLENCFEYARKFRNHPHAVDAGELILDYFNTRSEFAGLDNWAYRLLNLKMPHAAFNQKLASIRKASRAKILSEKVKSLGSYDDFSQGKSYLAAALSLEDKSLSSEALKQALARSKAERDIGTFVQAATAMADQEKDPRKKAAIYKSTARENLKVTRFKAALETYADMVKNAQLPADERRLAFDGAVNTALQMRDWKAVLSMTSTPWANEMSPSTKARAREHLSDVLMSPVPPPSGLPETLIKLGVTDEVMLALVKAQDKLPGALRPKVLQEAGSRCSTQSRQLYCRWVNLQRQEAQLGQLKRRLAAAPRDLNAIEANAQAFGQVANQLQSLEGSGEPLLESAVSMFSHDAYMAFAGYLEACADANPELKAPLAQKARETEASAKLYLERCQNVSGRDALLKERSGLCKPSGSPQMREFLQTGSQSSVNPPSSDPEDRDIEDLRKVLFAGKSDADGLLRLSQRYFQSESYHHAIATASLGISQYRSEAGVFKTVLGCSLLRLGLLEEAGYHLKSGAPLDGLKARCLGDLSKAGGD